MVSIDAALARIKDDWSSRLRVAHLERICRESGMVWRKRVLDPATMIRIFFLKILHRNTAMTNLARLCGRDFTAGAFCQGCRRLPLAALRRLLFETGVPLRSVPRGAAHSAVGLWRGHRMFLIDGSSCSMPDTPALQQRFGQPDGQRKGCGFPVAHLLILVDAHSGLILDVIISPLRTHDLTPAGELHGYLAPGDVLVGDRGFCSFGHVAALQQREVHALFRAHQRLKVVDETQQRCASRRRRCERQTLEFVARLGDRDRLALWRKPKKCARTMTQAQHAALPEYVLIRLVEYRIERPGHRTRRVHLLTTLVDPVRYSADALAELYGLRWQVETNLRHLKQTLGLDVLHSRTPAGVEKEIIMFAIVYNLVRSVMLAEARRRGVTPDRISFIDALRHLCWPILGGDSPLIINPLRPGRTQPRVRKRRPKQYPLMKQPRNTLKQQLLRTDVA